MEAVERELDFRGCKTFCKIWTGTASGKKPLLCLHGGPGATHDYLEPLGALAELEGRTVVMYDQIGNGRSSKPKDSSFWRLDVFLDELAAVRSGLGLEETHILGQSWGGMLALEHLLAKAGGVASLILADSLCSVPQWIAEANTLRSRLPKEARKALERHEQDGSFESLEFQEAMELYYKLHLCRLDPWPECLQRTMRFASENPEIYRHMFGASEFIADGTLKDWDVTGRLGEISVPTLVVSGRFDESTPAIAETLRGGILRSESVIFERSSHMPHLEEPELFLRTVGDFLNRAEGR